LPRGPFCHHYCISSSIGIIKRLALFSSTRA